MTSAHFIFIPAVLLVGVVIGWILGQRAAKDAYAMEMKKREEELLRRREEKRKKVRRVEKNRDEEEDEKENE